MRYDQISQTIRYGAVAGVAGGLAEIAWIGAYAEITGADPGIVARGVTTAAGVTALLPAAPAALGVSVHMTLAVLLGIGLAAAWRTTAAHTRQFGGPFLATVAALIGVWAVNFFVVLPAVNPAFVALLPYSVSFVSKMLFGIAAAVALRWQSVADARIEAPVYAEVRR